MKTLVIIPSRLSATRLPGKPLLKINGLSMISHVFKKAVDANILEIQRMGNPSRRERRRSWGKMQGFKYRKRNVSMVNPLA